MTHRWKWLAVAVLIIFGSVIWTRQRRQIPLPIVLTGSSIDANSCIDCHEDVVTSFETTPHSFTLRPGSNRDIMTHFAGKSAKVGDNSYSFEQVDDNLNFRSSEGAIAQVDWVFGSGHHALTPIALAETPEGQTALTQLYASWYPDNAIAATPGIDEFDAVLTELGRYHGFEETLDCFGCHASYLPLNDEKTIDFTKIVPGISCDRCHLGSEEHISSEGEVSMRSPWSQLPALEAINRCGECHRRLDEFTSDELVPTNPLLLRFAPVGLALSKCFVATNENRSQTSNAQHDGKRLDCITCHDPHLPAEKEASYYIEKCLQCHGTLPGQATTCSAEPMSSQCLSCHMPKSESDDHLTFTDHWIRIREK